MANNIYNVANKLLGVKGDIIRVRFRVEGRVLEAYVPDDEMWGAIKDILLNREYEYIPGFELENLKDKVVIDIGAHVGLYSLLASLYAKKVISIEPHPVNYRLLEINKFINNAQNIHPINTAIIGTKFVRSVRLCQSVHSGGASIMIESSSKCYDVPAQTLNEIVENYIDDVDSDVLLKMDVEGAEFDIFRSLDIGLLGRIRFIVMELHLKYGPLYDIVEKLKLANFQICYFHPPLIAKHAKPRIEVKDLLKLRILKSMIYLIASIGKLKNNDLVILFAYR
ncbi:MAG: hypothetical protein DRN04_14005 [Thermoprotei archaeon]|nr:MAG: hypothetical protein DRN04_14005 [Thermoprotei archaeon]